MPPLAELVTTWCQTGQQSCLDLIYRTRDIVMTNRRHWAAGSMFGFSGAATIFFGNSEIPWIFSYGAYLGFIASTAKYTSQNLQEIIRHGGPTVVTMLAIALFLFHGLTSWTPVLTWLPVFVSTTLLATVSIAPGMTEVFITLGEGLFTIRELGRSIGAPRNQATDVEQAQDLLPRMSEVPALGYRRYRSVNSIWSFIHRLPEARNIESADERTDESIELDNDSLSTTSDLRLVMQPLSPDPDLVQQYVAISNIVPMDEQMIWFPEAPQDHPLVMSMPRSTSGPITSQPSAEELILA